MASLTLEHIDKHFGGICALSDVDLHVEDGTFCVLLGPSGCGKSTLLQIVAGLVRQDRGSVLLDDRVVDHLEPKERDVAMVFQNYALYPHMTVAENLSFGLRMRGTSKAEVSKRMQETAQLLEIDNLLTRKPRQLSGGQKQRVAMGRALVRHPKIFLLDEPLSNLDAQLRINVRLELRKLHETIHTTILYVTHDQVEAMTLGDKVVVMRDGQVHQIGSPEEIYERPADTFVATFVGSPVMNFFKGTVRTKQGQALFQGHDFSVAIGNQHENLVGKQVELGIRPEDVELGTDKKNSMQAQVDLISNVGAEKYVHATLGKNAITARASKRTSYRSGETVFLKIDPDRAHFFSDGRRV
jgi:multiple sugar transport system ATP-binding protein